MRILVGVSGGFDSAAALDKLKREGHHVEGAILIMHEYTDTEGARLVCESLGVPLHIIDARSEFLHHVCENFVTEYANARTPNPCIICNREVKFRLLLDYALAHGFDKIATGHYASLGRVMTENGERYTLTPPRDTKKDQTYMLSRLTQDILSHLILPLADEKKEELREGSRLPVKEKKDSQEICFIPDNDYVGYVEGRVGTFPPGDFVDEDGRALGKHKGIIAYTVGQRKGLGISLGKRVFVKSIDKDKNTVTLSELEPRCDRISVSDVSYMGIPMPKEDLTVRALVKVRYKKGYESASVTFSGESAEIVFDTPVTAPTPGQTAAIFSPEGYLLASGFID